jgi:hypothetical protein
MSTRLKLFDKWLTVWEYPFSVSDSNIASQAARSYLYMSVSLRFAVPVRNQFQQRSMKIVSDGS